MIISNKHCMYELPNNVGLRILGNKAKSGKSEDIIEL